MQEEGQLPRAARGTSIPRTQGFLYFGSDCKSGACQLSNLLAHEVTFEGHTYPSVEHTYQAAKFPPLLRDQFATGGDLAAWDAMRFFVPADKVDAKVAFWLKKSMVGILAKMASNPKHAKKAGLPPKSKM